MSQSEYGGTTTTVAPPAQPPEPPASPGYTAPGGQPPHQPRGGGVVAGIILVLVGIGLLIGQFIPGVAAFSLWPVIIIAVGAVEALTPGREHGWDVARFFDGLVTVSVGLVFLAITTGYIGWSVWLMILSLWPVLLISAGLGIIGRASHQSWVRALGSLAVILALGYAASTAYAGSAVPGFTPATGGEGFSQSERTGMVREATLDLEVGLAETTIGSGGELISATGESSFGTPKLKVTREGSKADVLFRLGDGETFDALSGALGAKVDIHLSRDVLWDANIDAGISKLTADLRDVRVRSIVLNPGISECDVTLGDVPSGVREAVAEVKAGVSSVKVVVPADAEVRIESDSGLVSHSMDSRLVKTGDGAWETPGFSAAKDRGDGVWIIREKSGIGSFTLSTY